jgi:hypothetical protein
MRRWLHKEDGHGHTHNTKTFAQCRGVRARTNKSRPALYLVEHGVEAGDRAV